jgi:hypothetical protein
MAVFTYQTLYWAWLKMEKDEEKRDKNGMSRADNNGEK